MNEHGEGHYSHADFYTTFHYVITVYGTTVLHCALLAVSRWQSVILMPQIEEHVCLKCHLGGVR